jgi:hypothetical protein
MLIVIAALVVSILAIAGARQMLQEAMGKPKQTPNAGRVYAAFGILSLVVASVFAFREDSKPVYLVSVGLMKLTSGDPVYCSHPGCRRLATRLDSDAAKELEKTGTHVFMANSGAYCDQHNPTNWEHDGLGGLLLILGFFWAALTGGLIILYKGFISLWRIAPTKIRLV